MEEIIIYPGGLLYWVCILILVGFAANFIGLMVMGGNK
jgi:hypothetical protein